MTEIPHRLAAALVALAAAAMLAACGPEHTPTPPPAQTASSAPGPRPGATDSADPARDLGAGEPGAFLAAMPVAGV
jgi:hypothetical protein